MSRESELERFGLDGDGWLAMAREAEAPVALGSLGPYRLLREVGRGGQAVVYEAVRDDGGGRVAVKRLLAGSFADAAALRRFEREIEAVSGFSHPNIVRAEEVARHDGPPVLAMEWIDGVRVTEWARGRSRRDVLALLRKIADAVAHAHRCGVIHRDLKPANILVSADGEPHVLDFGIAKRSDLGDAATASATRTSLFLGTPAYSSPEQIAGDRGAVDARTDVYSLGVIAYELLVGRPPLDVGGGLRRVLEAIATEEPRRPRDLLPGFPPDLEAILLKMLAKDPARRYASMDLVAADLDRFERGDPIEAESLGRAYRLRKLARRHRVAVGVAAAFALLLGGFAVTMSVLYRRAEAEERRVAQVEEFLAAMLVPDGAAAGAPTRTVEDVLEQASRRLEAEPFDDPDVEGRLHLRLARNYGALWRWRDAARHAEKALAIYRALGDDEGTANALGSRGLARTFLVDPRAVDDLEEALRIVAEREGGDSREAASVIGSLAFAFVRAADPPDFARAESLYARALGILEPAPEPGPLVAGTHYSHAVLALEQGDPELAAERFRRALAVYDAMPRSFSITGARCREDYAKALGALGRAEEARDSLRRSREGRALDPSVCRAPTHVAGRLAAAGRGDAAAPLYLESLRLTCDYLAGRRPEHAERLRTLGEAMNGERPAAADLREIAEVCRQVAPGLLDLWGAGVDGLESVWRETRPEGAAACRAARTAVGPIPGLDPPPSGRSL